MVGSRGEVVVDAKFDCGYFVTGEEMEKEAQGCVARTFQLPWVWNTAVGNLPELLTSQVPMQTITEQTVG